MERISVTFKAASEQEALEKASAKLAVPVESLLIVDTKEKLGFFDKKYLYQIELKPKVQKQGQQIKVDLRRLSRAVDSLLDSTLDPDDEDFDSEFKDNEAVIYDDIENAQDLLGDRGDFAPIFDSQTQVLVKEKPEVEIEISFDQMSATITVIPKGDYIEPISKADLVKKIEKVGIKKGIAKHDLGELAQRASKGERIFKEIIATGMSPGETEDGKILWEITLPKDQSDIPVFVEKGQAIARKTEGKIGLPGFTVTGTQLRAKKPISVELFDGRGVRLTKKTGAFVASESGTVAISNNWLSINPFKDGVCKIDVAGDRMQVRLNIFPPVGEGKLVTHEDVEDKMRSSKVVYGIDKNAIETALIDAAAKKIVADLVIAVGTPSQPGKEGKVIFHHEIKQSVFSKSNLKKEKIFNPASHLTKTLQLCHVKKGDLLAELRFATQGEPGTDVLGKIVQAEPIPDGTLIAGDNVHSNDDFFHSQIAGHATLKDDVINVHEVLVIDGDVDRGSKDISFRGDVLVRGDVHDGRTIHAGGTVTIEGTLRAAKIVAHGDVKVCEGFIGRSKGSILAKGDVHLNFVEMATVESSGSIVVQHSSVNSTLIADTTIEMLNDKGKATGGLLLARDGVSLRTAGSELGVDMTIGTGVDFLAKSQLKNLTEKIISCHRQLSEVVEVLNAHKETIQKNGDIDADLRSVLESIVVRRNKLAKRLTTLMKKKQKFETPKEPNTSAKVRIHGMAYSGLLIVVNRVSLKIVSPVRGAIFGVDPRTKRLAIVPD